MKNDVLFWDVDTQFDFMCPEGKLYVPGAEEIIDKINLVRKYALDNGFSIVASTDWHRMEDREISYNPDFKKTFPAHCIADKPGSERVGYLGEVPIAYIPNRRTDVEFLRRIGDEEQFHVVIRKQATDVFSNPNTTAFIELISPKRIVVFGVALDVCVDQTLRGLGKFPEVKLFLLKEAVKGLGIRPVDELFKEYKKMGVEITELKVLREQFECG
ncbi:MAG: isochorismatase family protein [Sedimentisphaerales bacterium]|nr:isochorismatase family protein [Sedimentisphaerales bacterium]